VINTKEEYSFQNWFNLQLIEQELFQEDGFKFDLMKVSEKNSNEEYDIYFLIFP